MTDREKVITHLDDMRLFADTRVHRIVSPENWEVYSDLCDFIDLVKKEILALLKAQEAKEQCLKTKCVICPHCDNCDVDENGLLKEQETVVRCKDCKHYHEERGTCAKYHAHGYAETWYCADGERR